MNPLIPERISFPVFSSEKKQYSYEFLKRNKSNSKNISFEFNLSHIGFAEKNLQKPIIEISRDFIFLNEEPLDDTLIGELLNNASQSLFPLHLTVNQYGYLTHVINHQEISQRWKTLKNKLLQLYENNVSEKLIYRLDNIFHNSEKLIEYFQNDWFFLSFFLPFYGNYGENRCKELEYYFPIYNEKSAYQISLNLQDVYDTEGKSIILLSGKSIEKDENLVSGYILLNEDNSIYELKLNFSFAKDDDIQITISEQEDKYFIQNKNQNIESE